MVALVLQPLRWAPAEVDSRQSLLHCLADTVNAIGTCLQCGRLVSLDVTAVEDGLDFAVVAYGDVSDGVREKLVSVVSEIGFEIYVDWQPLRTFKRIHVLPFSDASPPDQNLTCEKYVKPYLMEHCGPLHEGLEFASGGCRFSVVATDPQSSVHSSCYVARDTDIFFSGPPLLRAQLTTATILPFLDTIETITPAGDTESAREACIRKYFEQRSTTRAAEEFITDEGIRFRVMSCDPSEGGVMPSTRVLCGGPPLTKCSLCDALAVRRCVATGCQRLICGEHAIEGVWHGVRGMCCPEHLASNPGCITQ